MKMHNKMILKMHYKYYKILCKKRLLKVSPVVTQMVHQMIIKMIPLRFQIIKNKEIRINQIFLKKLVKLY